MPEPETTHDDIAEPGWLRNSFWQVPKLKISKVKSWLPITTMSFHRDGGETIWRGDRHRLVLTLEEVPPALLQVEQGPAWQSPRSAPGALGFYPAGIMVRVVHPGARFVQLLWDMNLYSLCCQSWEQQHHGSNSNSRCETPC